MADWENISNDGWEDISNDSWEDVSPQSDSSLTQFAKNIGGTALGAADIVSGAVSAIPLWLKAQTDVALGGDPEAERKEMHESMARMSPSATAANIASRFGYDDPRTNQSYQYMMKPFEVAGEAIDTGVEALGGGEAAKLAAEGLSMALPIPFAGRATRGLGRVAETVDPGLRALDRQTPISTPEVPGTPMESVAPNGDSVRWIEEPANPQGDMFGTINPYDLGGHVTALEEGRATTIDATQPDLGGRVERFQDIPDAIQANIDQQVTQQFGEQAVQGDLFEPQTNMHRAYDQFGPDELPRDLSRAEFEQTVNNLADQEGTRYRKPEDMDAAYEQYRLDMEGRQGGLFDRPSQQEGFGRTMADEAAQRSQAADLTRRIDSNPDVINTRKGIERIQAELDNFTRRKWTKKAEEAQRKLDVLEKRLNTLINKISNEPQTPVTVRPPMYSPSDIRDNVTMPQPGEPTQRATTPRQPVEGNFVPIEVTQPMRAATENIPGLTEFRDAAPTDVTPNGMVVQKEAPSPNRAVTPLERVTEGIPNLGEQAQAIIFGAMDADSIRANAKGEKDGSASHLKRSLYSGANWASLIRNSSVIKGIYSLMNNADNLTKKALNEKIVPIERALIRLNKQDQTTLWNTMLDEMFTGARRSETELANIFARAKKPEAMATAYRKLRRGLEETGAELNAGRIAAGLEPVNLVDAYVSSRWRGNFKSAAYVDGKLVGYLRDTSKRGLKAQKKALGNQFKDVVWKDEKPDSYGAPSDTLEASFMEALRFLDQNDPLVKAFVEAQKTALANEASGAMGMPFHAEAKGNIRGFIGDRPDLSAEKNARQGLNSQIQYMKNVYKWSEQQKAVAEAKKVLTDPELVEAQPNNVAYAKQYIKNALGFGTQIDIRNLENKLVRGLGYDRSQAMNALNFGRGIFYTKQLGLLNPKATLVQLTQPFYAIPMHMDFVARGLKHNPVTTLISQMADLRNMWSGDATKMSQVGKDAIAYAQERGILSINVLDDIRDIGDSLVKRTAEKVANVNQMKAEEFGRTYTYLGMIHHLHQSGLRGETLYRTAEAATNRSMVDYRKFEQPMWMEQGGLASRAAGTLKNFVNNQANQLVYYGNQAKKGNIAPLATLMGLQYFLAGNFGMMGMETALQVWDEFIKPFLGPKAADVNPKLWMLSNLPDVMNYGGISALTGINMFGSLSQGTLAGADSFGSFAAPFAEDLFKSGKAIGSALIDPTNPNKWREALYENLPPHGKGMMENLDPALTSPAGVSLNPRDLNKGMYRRDDFDKAVRNFGATSFEEAVTKDKAFEASKQEMQINEAKTQLKDKYIEAVGMQDRARMKDAITQLQRYMTGDEIATFLTNALQNAYQNRNQDVIQRQYPKSLESGSSVKKYQRIRNATQ